MNFSEYQKKANATAIYDSKFSILYPTLGLAGEAGEVAEKVKKIIRDNKSIVKVKYNYLRGMIWLFLIKKFIIFHNMVHDIFLFLVTLLI